MPFPDRIERTLDLPHPPEKGWAAITTAEGLGTWFGQRAEVDLRVGGTIRLAWDSGDTATLTIQHLDEPRAFGYTWHLYGLPDEDPRRTYVEFLLEPTPSGTRLTVLESGFAQAPDDTAYRGNIDGWKSELGELAEYLDAA